MPTQYSMAFRVFLETKDPTVLPTRLIGWISSMFYERQFLSTYLPEPHSLFLLGVAGKTAIWHVKWTSSICASVLMNTLEIWFLKLAYDIFGLHTMDMLWEKFQWILHLYMKPINFQSKALVVCSVTAAVFIDYCLKKLNVFSQHIGKKTNKYLNSTEQIPRNWNFDQLSMLITS